MPCCSAVLSAAAAAAAASRTPPWLHRLHAKGGLSFPSNLHIDDLLYGQRRGLPPPPPAPPSSSAVPKEPPPSTKPKQPKTKQQQQQQPPPPPPQKPPQGSTNPSLPNPSSSSNPQPPQLQLSNVVADLFVTPSSAPLPLQSIKAFRKQNRPRPRLDKSSRPTKANKDKAKVKVKKRRRSERAADADGERSGERSGRTEVTVIDTSTDGWKAAKLLLRRGAVWKVRDKTSQVSEPEDPTKVKRRAGLVSKIQRDREKQKQKEKEANSSGNVHAISGDVMKELDGPFQALKRSRCSEPEPEGQIIVFPH
ncbi:arp2/3 complex-activating protein rickA [Oryza brachyantha]|uniref:arp2/3 complex-activating protein rickA n=1 Tax=Oryza brachyantha TaxID=4533 RepID=UPI001ADC974D|nr:arp2/3 complex-activating protein rickA [Oryza brachyantha]